MQSLLTTFNHRPFIAAFLIAFLLIGLVNRGLGRTLLMLFTGYGVALLSEACSIRWGFPYGTYRYLYENLRGEMLVLGVPVWDSLSYSFIAYASYETATWLLLPYPPLRLRIVLASLLMVGIDLIADPVALRGGQWFLGPVFEYPHGGIFFGVPLSNFFGWFLVGILILSLYEYLKKSFRMSSPPLLAPKLGPVFYLSILAFPVVIAFRIKAWGLGILGTLLFWTVAIVCLRKGGPEGPMRKRPLPP